jgi:hypothetical protein
VTALALVTLLVAADAAPESTEWKASEHVWIIVGPPLGGAGLAAVFFGIARIEVARDEAVLAGTSVEKNAALDQRNLGFGVLGFGLTAIAAAIMMIVYNAML